MLDEAGNHRTAPLLALPVLIRRFSLHGFSVGLNPALGVAKSSNLLLIHLEIETIIKILLEQIYLHYLIFIIIYCFFFFYLLNNIS
jgi:hypothetical protein